MKNKNILFLLFAMSIVLAFSPMFSIPTTAADTLIPITEEMSVSESQIEIQTEIQNIINDSNTGENVIVTDNKTSAVDTFTPDIPADVTVI